MEERARAERPRTIGGGTVDNFRLLQLVLERGGVQSVINNRAFKKVAHSLEIPKSCTSAATVLRQYYADQLYLYEQRFVHNREAFPQELVTLGQLKGGTGSNRVRNVARSLEVPTSASGPSAFGDYDQRAQIRSSLGDELGSHGNRLSQEISMQNPPVHPVASMEPNGASFMAPPLPAVQGYRGRRQSTGALAEHGAPVMRRGRNGVDPASLTAHQAAIAQQEVGQGRGVTMPFNVNSPADRERLVAALKCPIAAEVSWALGVLNVLSFDQRNLFVAGQYSGLLPALTNVLGLHLDDVMRRRVFGVAAGLEKVDRYAPRNAAMSAALVRELGDPMSGGVSGAGLDADGGDGSRAPTLQRNDSLFNCADTIAVDREQWAVVAVNVLRNMSYYDMNACAIAIDRQLLAMTAEMLMTFQVPSTIRVGIMDMWINISPYLNVSINYPGHVILKTCIRLLDPFLDGAEYSRFANAGEILARLAASPERNENALVHCFEELLPRLIDMLGGRDRRYVNAGLAALCNCSAFDWAARGRIARTPRAVSRLVTMLSDPELAPRASLTLLNLAEAPSNRCVMLMFEKQLVSYVMQGSPAADTVASVLFDMSAMQ